MTIAATDLWISREIHNHTILVRVGGEIDIATVAELSEQLRVAEALLTTAGAVVVDLTEVTHLSTVGVTALAEHAQRCAELDSELRVVAEQDAVLRPITAAGLADVIPTTPAPEPDA